MKLFLISRVQDAGYDQYVSAVVVAECEVDAMLTHPSALVTHADNGVWMGTDSMGGSYKAVGNSWLPYKEGK